MKRYTWNYKRTAKHLVYLLIATAWIAMYLWVSNQDYLIRIGK